MKLPYLVYLVVGIVTLAVTTFVAQRVARGESFPAVVSRVAESAREAEVAAAVDDTEDAWAFEWMFGNSLLPDDEFLVFQMPAGTRFYDLGDLGGLSEFATVSDYALGLSGVHESDILWMDALMGDLAGSNLSAAVVPEPAALSLLCVGSVAVLRRRR